MEYIMYKANTKPASIVYKPHCSACGAVINEKPQYRNIVMELETMVNLAEQYTEVYPSRCEHCGQPFSTIEIPMPEQLDTEYIK